MYSQKSIGVACLTLVLGTWGAFGQAPTQIVRTQPDPQALRFEVPDRVALTFGRALLASSVDSTSFTAANAAGSLTPSIALSPDGRVVTLTISTDSADQADGADFLRVEVNGDALRDIDGRRVDADGNGTLGGRGIRTFATSTPMPLPTRTGTALIMGRVFDAATNRPLGGVTVKAKLYPATDASPYLAVPDGVSDAQGWFTYTTTSFDAVQEFLVKVRSPNTSERLHRVRVLAGGCVRIPDSFVQLLNPATPVNPNQASTLADPRAGVSLQFPINALAASSSISVTGLRSPDLIRDRLPVNNAPTGSFTDIEGVFGEQTNELVTMRVPNLYNLAIGTRVPFGKVDHNDLQWSDLRDYSAPGMEDLSLGTVRSDGMGGSYIEVQFDHFCTVCTSYCLMREPSNPRNDSPGPRDPWGTPQPSPPFSPSWPDNPSWDRPGVIGTIIENDIVIVPNNSRVLLSEGHVWEEIPLPGFDERGRPVGISLGWASYAAKPSMTLCAGFENPNVRPLEGSVFTFEAAGKQVTALYGRSTSQRPRGAWIWDGRDGMGVQLGTGFHPYTISITNLSADEQISLPAAFGQGWNSQPAMAIGGGPAGNYVRPPGGPFASLPSNIIPISLDPIEARGVLINEIDSAYGAGWTIREAHRLHLDADGCITLTFGNGCWSVFVPGDRDPVSGRNQWVSSAGDLSHMSQDSVTGFFERAWPDGRLDRFNPNGLIVSSSDRYGYTTTFAWLQGLLDRVTSPAGNWWSFEYDGNGKIMRIQDSAGRMTNFSVDAAGDLTQIVDAEGAVRNFIYDADHLLTEQRTPRGARFTYEWVRGRVVRTQSFDTDGSTRLRERTYEPQAIVGEVEREQANGLGFIGGAPIPVSPARVNRMIDGNGELWQHEANGQGLTIRQVDPLGREVLVTRGPDGKPSRRTFDDGSYETYVYGANDRLIELSEFGTNSSLIRRTTAEYNGPYGAVSKITEQGGFETRIIHDALGNIVGLVDPSGALWASFFEDLRFPDLPTRIIDPDGGEMQFLYNVKGNAERIITIMDPGGVLPPEVSLLDYDPTGKVAMVTRADGRSMSMTHDALGRLASVTDGASRTWQLSYLDALCGCSTGNLTELRWPNGTTESYDYDGLGRLIRDTDRAGSPRTFVWDAEDGLVMQTNRVGQTIRTRYDGARQRVEQETSGTAAITQWSYDQRGRITAVDDGVCRVDYAYDLVGNLAQVTNGYRLNTVGGAITLDHVLNYGYDALGRRTSRTDNFGAADEATTYDTAGRAASWTVGPMGGSSHVWSLLRSGGGRPQSLQHPFGGLETTFAYDWAGRLRHLSHGSPAQLDFEALTREPSGRLQSQRQSSAARTLQRDYGFDAAGRLASSTWSEGLGGTPANVDFSPSLIGTLLDDTRFIYSYDLEGRLVEARSRVGGLSRRYTWNALSQLIGYEEWDAPSSTRRLAVSYVYDGLGRRVMKNVDGVPSINLYDGSNIIHRLDGSGTPELSLVAHRSVGHPQGLYDHVNGLWFTLHYDLQGSLAGVFGDQGQLLQTLTYDDYGAPLEGHGLLVRVPHGYVGREHDLESGLVMLSTRPYDPATGRFVAPNPRGSLHDRNAYAYAGSDPIGRQDALGLGSQLTVPGHLIEIPIDNPWGGATTFSLPTPGSPVLPARDSGVAYGPRESGGVSGGTQLPLPPERRSRWGMPPIVSGIGGGAGTAGTTLERMRVFPRSLKGGGTIDPIFNTTTVITHIRVSPLHPDPPLLR